MFIDINFPLAGRSRESNYTEKSDLNFNTESVFNVIIIKRDLISVQFSMETVNEMN